MTISSIIEHLEELAPLAYQESYDNCGLITGSPSWNCTGIMISLDATEEVIADAISKNCNLLIAHHPIVFKGLKKITGKNYVERAIILAIKNDIAVYAFHTNLDNVSNGVNGRMADRLGLINRSVLLPKPATLKKLFTFVPVDKTEEVRQAIFSAGGGNIGNYSECSFSVEGTGSFKAGEGSDPYVGTKGKRHYEKETKIEVVFPAYLENKILASLIEAHPYEEVAFDVLELANPHPGVGSGLMGELSEAMSEYDFLIFLKQQFNLSVVRHTALIGKPVKQIALCGGAGSFLISNALAQKADFLISSDLKYHEFFDAENKMVIADIGHYESEQFTVDLIHEILKVKFSNFALLKTEVNTNPVSYFLS